MAIEQSSPGVPEPGRCPIGCQSMTEEPKKLCDACHERLAVHHMHTFFGEAEQKRDLCVECFERLAPSDALAGVRRLQEALRKGNCKYCGAPAVGGSSRKNLWCKQGRDDLAEFDKRPENVTPEDPGDDEARWEQLSQHLQERQLRRDAFIRERVRQRGKHGTG